jgi:hypothetical protein
MLGLMWLYLRRREGSCNPILHMVYFKTEEQDCEDWRGIVEANTRFGTECCTTVHLWGWFEKQMEGVIRRPIIGRRVWTDGDLSEMLAHVQMCLVSRDTHVLRQYNQ